MRRCASLIVGVQLLMLACSRGGRADHRSPLQERLDAIAQEMEAGTVGQIEILQIRANTSYIAQVAPEVLESAWDYKFIIRRIDGPRLDQMVAALRTATLEPAKSEADLPWGVVFYSLADEKKRLGAIYFDRTGHAGALNELPVSFGGGFFPQLRKVLLPPYE